MMDAPTLGRHRGRYDHVLDLALAGKRHLAAHRGNPDQGPRCGECRLGLGTHNTADPLCELQPDGLGSE